MSHFGAMYDLINKEEIIKSHIDKNDSKIETVRDCQG